MEQNNSYLQNQEDIFVSHFFKDSETKNLTLLDIGANDGVTFSNSRKLIMEGWAAHLLEPSPKAFSLLQNMYGRHDSHNVTIHGFGIADQTGILTFHESGSFENKGEDIALLSCLDEKEKERWGDKVQFEQTQAHFYTFKDFLKNPMLKPDQIFDFISIDAEGHDFSILKQIDLNQVKCRCLCIEYNSIPELKEEISRHVYQFGFTMALMNPENLIFTR